MKLNDFITDNLIAGYNNGDFSEYQVNIFSANYLMRGQISQQDFDDLQALLYPPEVEEEPEED